MTRKVLGIILVLAFLARFVGLGEHPAGFTPDEASFGYDAYSILKTGHDQWGNFLPITFKSFGDYKLPLYTYISIPFIALFDLNIFSTRIAASLFGTLAVFATYLLVEILAKNKKLALISATFLAFSPWHVALSRGAFEANLTTAIMPLGLWFLEKGKENKRFTSFGVLTLGLNLFSYHTARFLTIPLLLIYIFLFYKRGDLVKLSKSYLNILISAIIIALIGLSLIFGAGGRLASSNIFSLSKNVFNDRFKIVQAGEQEILAKIFQNEFTYTASKFVNNYLEYFSPQFLFLEGSREATYGMVPGRGVLYMFEVGTILAGAYFFIKKSTKFSTFLLLWIAISVLPAALSLGPGLAANRAAFMMPALQIVSALGAYQIYQFFKGKGFGKHIILAGSVALTVSVASFFENYWYTQPVIGSRFMIYGMEEVFDYVSTVSPQYEKIIISRSISEPHIYPMFFEKVEPRVVQEASKNWNFEEKGLLWVDQLGEYNLGKYRFGNIEWKQLSLLPNALIIAKYESVPKSINVVKTFYYPGGLPSYVAVDTTPFNFASK